MPARNRDVAISDETVEMLNARMLDERKYAPGELVDCTDGMAPWAHAIIVSGPYPQVSTIGVAYVVVFTEEIEGEFMVATNDNLRPRVVA